jgi:hypothetical protein
MAAVQAARWLENATRNKDAGIDARSCHIFVCKSDGRMGKHCSGKDGGDPAVGLLSHYALTAMDLGRERGV